MLAASLAPWFARHGIHYGWVMVALTFVTAICSTAAIGMPGVLILPISREFGWSRGDISGAMALMLVMFGGMAPFAGALMLRYGLRRVVVAAALTVVVALIAPLILSEGRSPESKDCPRGRRATKARGTGSPRARPSSRPCPGPR